MERSDLELSGADKKFKVPRLWSNAELRKFGPLFTGLTVNVSAWTDEDKEGGRYRDYFPNAADYWTTNYKSGQKGMQHVEKEIFLDLEADLDPALAGRFDVVFNHTTLEHVFNFWKAFANMAAMSKEALILVVPYIQQVHGKGYLDFWRFTPHAMNRLYRDAGMKMRYCSANGADQASIYLFCMGFRSRAYNRAVPRRFDLKIDADHELYGTDYRNVIGGRLFD